MIVICFNSITCEPLKIPKAMYPLSGSAVLVVSFRLIYNKQVLLSCDTHKHELLTCTHIGVPAATAKQTSAREVRIMDMTGQNTFSNPLVWHLRAITVFSAAIETTDGSAVSDLEAISLNCLYKVSRGLSSPSLFFALQGTRPLNCACVKEIRLQVGIFPVVIVDHVLLALSANVNTKKMAAAQSS